MGSGPSKLLEERKRNLRSLDQTISDKTTIKRELIQDRDKLQETINKMNNELDDLTDQINTLDKDKETYDTEKEDLEQEIEELNVEMSEVTHLLNVVKQAIEQIDQYGNLQERTLKFLEDEYEELYNKVILRQQLKFKSYSNRNDSLSRTINKIKSNFSNSFRNSEYQTQHNKYFMSLNAIFWWVYYILFFILTYQIIYIQIEMNRTNKIILLGVLFIYPLLYRFYDLVIMKI
jgi:chromosome segregation ATPase